MVQSTILTLSDWYHEPAKTSSVNGVPLKPYSTLINGKGRYTGSPANTSLAVVNVKKGTRYRFRIISMSCDPNFTFSIDQHNMTIIEADGENTTPLVVDQLQIFAGQRYSVVITANQPVGNYWIRANPDPRGVPGFDGGRNSAIFRYLGASNSDPTTNSTVTNPMKESNLHPLENPAAPGQPHVGGADVVLLLQMAVDFTAVPFPVFQLNNVSFVPPNVPALLQILSGAQTAQDLLPHGSYYELPRNKVVELTIPGTAFELGGPHSFSVVRSADSNTYNWKNPVRRDTVSTGFADGNTTIRFVTDNAGPWFLHCHIDWHLELGLAIVFAEDIPHTKAENPTPAAWNKLCPSIFETWDACSVFLFNGQNAHLIPGRIPATFPWSYPSSLSTIMSNFDIAKARANFPALNSGYIFADNAGGSQVTQSVVDRISDYLINTNVQLGADYSVSIESTRRSMVEAPTEAAKLFNAKSPSEIVFSHSSTMNLDNLSRALESDIKPGDEFIITTEHEANVGPWKKLAARTGAVLKVWKATPTVADNPYSLKLKIKELLPLVTSKTRIVAFTACSNILGSIVPVKEVVAAVRADAEQKGAPKVEISVDCVAYSPHRLVNVQDWNVDFAVLSFYKVYGPHISALYVRSATLEKSTKSLVHHFLKLDHTSYKLQPGGPGYEVAYATTGAVDYLLSLTSHRDLTKTFDGIAEHEQTLVAPLLEFLTAPAQRERGVRVVGEEEVNLSRVPTISFLVVGQKPIKSKDVVKVFDQKGGIGIRYGHFYAYSLVDEFSPKVDIDDGVVRISLVHYNTVEEVERIIAILKEVLAE
ncbi:hypothetical protein DXG01_000646 [Tephrocybe rancida]|nr:hypothetical protein DXG01_000646 [Tephrocybe rancida]